MNQPNAKHFTSPFASDEDAGEVWNESANIQAALIGEWTTRPDPTISLEGCFTMTELLAILHYHPGAIKPHGR